jgi:hypothetical protein
MRHKLDVMPAPAREPQPEIGPAMRSLPERWRRAVEALFITKGDMTAAWRMAGSMAGPKGCKVIAGRVFHDPRVVAAVREEVARRIGVIEPKLLGILDEIMLSPKEKAADRLRAIGMVWERSRPAVMHHKIEVEAHLNDDQRDMAHYVAMKQFNMPAEAFVQRFGPNGLARVEAMVLAEEARQRAVEHPPPTIEADYAEVTDAAAG